MRKICLPVMGMGLCLMVGNTPTYAQQQNRPVVTTPVILTPDPVPVYSGTVNVNYIRTWDAMGPITDPNALISAGYQDVKQATQYIDGLGRPLQTVNRQMTPQAKDMVAPVVYDAFGRETYKYLPYVSTETNGLFKADPFNAQKNFMQPQFPDEQVYYGKINYEASPLNRVTKIMMAGNSWAGSNKGTSLDYLVNTANDAVRIWNIDNNDLPYNPNDKDVTTNIPVNPTAPLYAAGELYKQVTTDEHGNRVEEYKNKDGLVVLKKVESGDQPVAQPGLPTDIVLPNATVPNPVTGTFIATNSITLDLGFESAIPFTAEIATAPLNIAYDGFLCTYYVYDDFNRVRFVMPPKAVTRLLANGWQLTADIINELCFRYEYDGRNRLIAKKVPGTNWQYMIYDVRDRLVFTQDGNQRDRGQWMTTLYDNLNRPVLTGLMTGYNGHAASLQSDVNTQTGSAGESNVEGIVVNKYPVPAGAVFTALTKTYFDNYGFTNKSFNPNYNSLLDAGSNGHPEPTPAQSTANATNLVTGSQVRVLTNPNNLQTGNWLTTVHFYDNEGRVIQTNNETLKGTLITTNRYNFTDKIICTYVDQTIPGGTPASLHVKTSMEYDHAGRLLEVWKTINDDASKKTVVTKNEYDELGQLKSKQLGHKKDDNGNYTTATYDALETLAFDYNIRGWMTGINKGYANGGGAVNGVTPWFGMELNYDKGFQLNQYNGNIAGTKWRSKGDGEQRGYGYTYDKAGRLLGADFTQYDGSGYTDHPTIQFDMVMGDGLNPATAYDANGNIKAMKQVGLKLGSSHIIDDLEYAYHNEGNRLKSVTDKAVDANGVAGGNWGLGDFTDNNKNSDDYGYDASGNLVVDLNKKFTGSNNPDPDVTTGGAISYNHMNLPWQVQVDGGNKGNIRYTYDAAGVKLQKTVYEKAASVGYNNINVTSDVTTTTNYVGRLEYETKFYADLALVSLNYTDKLQSLGQEEGRIRYIEAKDNIAAHFEYDYFVKDHLGNTRLVLTEERKNNIYQATMEVANRPYEVTLFGDKVNTTEKNKSELNGGFDTDDANQKVSKLNGTTEEGRVGPGVILKVMAGDKIKAFTYAWYKADEVINTVQPGLTSILTNMLSQLTPGVTGLLHGATTGSVTNGLLQPGITDLLGKQIPGVNAPRAYLNWVLLDEEAFKMADGNAIPVPYINDQQKRLLDAGNGDDIEMKKNGYLYVFVSNESRGDVYFDDIRVEHKRGALLEETHYYPFGLEMRGICSRAAKFGDPANKRKFNKGSEFQSQEFSDGSGLDWYATQFRSLDPQLGRWWQIDPRANESESPYVSMGNNPARFNDPLGDTILDAAVKADKNWSKAYDKFLQSKAGKRFVKNYSPGGKYGKTTVEFKIGGNASGNTKAFSVNKKDGKATELPYDKPIKGIDKVAKGESKDSYLKFEISLRPEDMSNPAAVVEGGETILHETQHVDIDQQTLISDKFVMKAYYQHADFLKPVNSDFYKQRAEFYMEYRTMWKAEYDREKAQGKVKSEEEFIKSRINDFRNE